MLEVGLGVGAGARPWAWRGVVAWPRPWAGLGVLGLQLGLLGLCLRLRRHHLRNQRLCRLILQKTQERSSGVLGNRSSSVLATF